LSITSSEVPESLLPLPSKVIDALSGATLVARFANTPLWQRLMVVVGNAGCLLDHKVPSCASALPNTIKDPSLQVKGANTPAS
jgi:hypothetical protein